MKFCSDWYEFWAMQTASVIGLSISTDKGRGWLDLEPVDRNLAKLIVLLELSGKIPEGLFLPGTAEAKQVMEQHRNHLQETSDGTRVPQFS